MPLNPLHTIESYSSLKLLGEPTRLHILRLLMAQPATLSQLGKKLKLSPARVRHHLKQLEAAGFIELSSTRPVRGFIEKYYRASASAYRINLAITPEESNKHSLLVVGSDDLALELLALALNDSKAQMDLKIIPVGSLDGLIALRQGLGHLAGCHLYDPPSQDYNLPYVRHLFPDRDVKVVSLAQRQQGLITAAGNPLDIHDLSTLAERNLRFINRNKGSGTRIMLDHHLKKAGLSPHNLQGYDHEVNTHAQVAQAVAKGRVDAGLGLLAAAHQHDLGFVPIFEERFDLVFTAEGYASPELLPLLEHIHSANFRQAVGSLGGYGAADAGMQRVLN